MLLYENKPIERVNLGRVPMRNFSDLFGTYFLLTVSPETQFFISTFRKYFPLCLVVSIGKDFYSYAPNNSTEAQVKITDKGMADCFLFSYLFGDKDRVPNLKNPHNISFTEKGMYLYDFEDVVNFYNPDKFFSNTVVGENFVCGNNNWCEISDLKIFWQQVLFKSPKIKLAIKNGDLLNSLEKALDHIGKKDLTDILECTTKRRKSLDCFIRVLEKRLDGAINKAKNSLRKI